MDRLRRLLAFTRDLGRRRIVNSKEILENKTFRSDLQPSMDQINRLMKKIKKKKKSHQGITNINKIN